MVEWTPSKNDEYMLQPITVRSPQNPPSTTPFLIYDDAISNKDVISYPVRAHKCNVLHHRFHHTTHTKFSTCTLTWMYYMRVCVCVVCSRCARNINNFKNIIGMLDIHEIRYSSGARHRTIYRHICSSSICVSLYII